jgi:AbrB family looped-hinge helix DNA binding protein
MRISSKRQIALPKKVMEALDLRPGDEVEFEVEKKIATGRYKEFNNLKDLLKDLHGQD